MTFVPRTSFPDYRLTLASFKGHHQKALTKFGHLAPQIDLILEVRDSRAPVSTTNVLFDRVLARKQKIILYSKKDLSIMKPALLRKWHQNEPFLFVDTRNPKDARRILDAVGAFYSQMKPPPPLGLRAMIIGMPNVGKSTLVNTLRSVGYSSQLPTGISSKKNKKVARTGGQPGVTRNTSEIIRLSRDPDLLVYDTPGVFLPTVKDPETMLALSLVGCIQESFVDPVIQADYLLYVLNLQSKNGEGYAEFMDRPTNDIHELLHNIAKKKGRVSRDGSWDQLGMAQHWTNTWRQGKLRKFKGLFDVPAILEVSSTEMKQTIESELERLKDSGVHTRIINSLGEDGTGNSKARNRTAKDREFDIRNQLFKL
ncbi:P-loop containing nucleoside triphosphate hydrolase protein [Metschnikowia bicuspidata var. bicuspidata NRRL YB-4993]|uniref:p-loop containing nucleoside triphosphate hydrolase protein n=1 Tax=Metschnikowia bicuspidata var. bicuspidata NRRL YB-4993 TaxID=869754 RepID=A0A1A0GZ47_9ASCO|nr:P-loop containing nucleoside triphosphate hydrolase protein [Metschnikowia bicuspidata var. bicuspidata NRRL YB-4993]OBA16965.1 P-loop containing nucleoside triphosphate hydrolase protein [Metschnikowia bicuspidata var. bicuspidata NRRL YB-4993]